MARHGAGSSIASGVVVLIAIGFLLIALYETQPEVKADKTINASFSSTDGLVVGSKVVLAGVAVGKVGAIRLDPRTYLSDVSFSLSNRLVLPGDSSLAIRGGGPPGSAVIVVLPGHSQAPLQVGEAITQTSPPHSLEQDIGAYIFGSQLTDEN